MDTWRIGQPEPLEEGKIYEPLQSLQSKQVPNVASAVWHGYVDKYQALSSML